MNKLLVICFALTLLIVPAFVFAASCDSTEDEYFIKFTFEGEEYTCSFGIPDSDIDVPYAVVTTDFLAQVPEGELIEFFGSSVESVSQPEDLDFFVRVQGYLYAETPGSYSGDYSLTDVFNSVWVWIYSDSTWYPYSASSGTVTVDVFNDIGGSVEGSFDATFSLSGDTIIRMELGDESQTITGTFRLERISEEDLPEPEIN